MAALCRLQTRLIRKLCQSVQMYCAGSRVQPTRILPDCSNPLSYRNGKNWEHYILIYFHHNLCLLSRSIKIFSFTVLFLPQQIFLSQQTTIMPRSNHCHYLSPDDTLVREKHKQSLPNIDFYQHFDNRPMLCQPLWLAERFYTEIIFLFFSVVPVWSKVVQSQNMMLDPVKGGEYPWHLLRRTILLLNAYLGKLSCFPLENL